MRCSRRGLLALGLAPVLLAAVPGCAASGSNAGDKQGDDKVEVFSWWIGAGEQEALETIIEDFKAKNPQIEFINATVAGGAGANAKSVLATRFDAGDPPDSFQVLAGSELLESIKAGRVQDITAIFEKQGWRDKFPKVIMDLITVDGKIYAVPMNVSRVNLLWYNPKTLASAGLAGPPRSWGEFLVQASALRAKGITPIAVGPLWTQKQLLEAVLLDELGVEGYVGLWNGSTDWYSPHVIAALVTFSRVMANSDVKNAASDWQPAMDKVGSGAAAYLVMGDWAYQYNVRNKGMHYKTDFEVVVSPGTEGVYDFCTDSFALAKGAPHPGAAEQWLVECGSADVQDLFNPQKGSIPARVDADRTKYTGYTASALSTWQDVKTKVVGSLTHGVMISAALNAELDTILKKFISDNDPDAFADAFVQAYQAKK